MPDKLTLFPNSSFEGGELPPSLKKYALGRKLGIGGMGVVYQATQIVGVKREVAIKFINRRIDSDEGTRFLMEECQALASLQHPNIATFYEVETEELREPFFVMELVHDPQYITTYCRNLPVPKRLELFLQVCKGLDYAHKNNVLHLDISPRNILVTSLQGKPLVKIIDFGLAALRQEANKKPDDGIGSWDYMSPERLGGFGERRLDATADVYSLGALLFQLVTGRQAFTYRSIQEAQTMTSERLSRGGLTPPPSAAIRGLRTVNAQMADQGCNPHLTVSRWRLRKLARSLEGDIDCIVSKAVQPKPDMRYASVELMSRDIELYLSHQPNDSLPIGWRARTRKFWQRDRISKITGLAAIVLTTAACIWSVIAWQRAVHTKGILQRTTATLAAEKREKTIEVDNHKKAIHRAYDAMISNVATMIDRHDYAAARSTLPILERDMPQSWEWNYLSSRVEASEAIYGRSETGFSRLVTTNDRIYAGGFDGSLWSWKADGSGHSTRKPHDAPVIALGLCNGYTFTVAADGSLSRWSSDSLNPAKCSARAGDWPYSAETDSENWRPMAGSFSPDGKWFSLESDGEIHIWKADFKTGTLTSRQKLVLPGAATKQQVHKAATAWTTNGLVCALWRYEEVAHMFSCLLCEWALDGKDFSIDRVTPLFEYSAPGAGGDSQMLAGEMRPDVMMLAIPVAETNVPLLPILLVNWKNMALIFRVGKDAESTTTAVMQNNAEMLSAAFDRSGNWLATADRYSGNRIRLWNLQAAFAESEAMRSKENEVKFGSRASVPPIAEVREAGTSESAFAGHRDAVTSLQFQDGYLFSASRDGTVRRWSSSTKTFCCRPLTMGSQEQLLNIVWLRFLHNGQLLTARLQYPWFHTWDCQSENGSPAEAPIVEEIKKLAPNIADASGGTLLAGSACNRSGDVIAASFVEGTTGDASVQAAIFVQRFGKTRKIATHLRATAIALSEDGLFLAAAGGPPEVESGTNATVVAGCFEVHVWRLDRDDDQPCMRLQGFNGRIRTLAFQPGTNRLWAAGCDSPSKAALGAIRVWDLEHKDSEKKQPCEGIIFGQKPARLTGDIKSLCFVPNCQRVVAGPSVGMALAVYDPMSSSQGAQGAPALENRFAASWGMLGRGFEPRPINSLSCHPDGSRLVAACDDGTVRILNTQTWETLLQLRGAGGAVEAVDWDPTSGGQRIAVASPYSGLLLYNAAGFGKDAASQTVNRSAGVHVDPAALNRRAWEIVRKEDATLTALPTSEDPFYRLYQEAEHDATEAAKSWGTPEFYRTKGVASFRRLNRLRRPGKVIDFSPAREAFASARKAVADEMLEDPIVEIFLIMIDFAEHKSTQAECVARLARCGERARRPALQAEVNAYLAQANNFIQNSN